VTEDEEDVPQVLLREPLSAASLVQQRVDVWQGFDEGLGDGI
jgi:hypothetical protein